MTARPVRALIEAIYVRAHCETTGLRSAELGPAERIDIAVRHERAIEADARVIEGLIEAARGEGIAEVYRRFRSAPGADPEMVDQLMTVEDVEPDGEPVFEPKPRGLRW